MLNLNFQPFPIINTQRLLLRQIKETDVDSFFALRSNEYVMNKLDKEPAKTKDEIVQLLNKINTNLTEGSGISWAVCLKDTNEHIGNVSFHNIYKEHCRAEIGYALMPQFHRQGFMQEAIPALLEFGFQGIKLHSIEAKINPQNEASKSILEKNGFVKEAHFKESYLFKNRFSDTAIYCLLNPERSHN